MKRKFIAGAVCPSCGKQDKIVLLADQDEKVMECVSCGYKQIQGAEVAEGESAEVKGTETNNDETQTIKWK